MNAGRSASVMVIWSCVGLAVKDDADWDSIKSAGGFLFPVASLASFFEWLPTLLLSTSSMVLGVACVCFPASVWPSRRLASILRARFSLALVLSRASNNNEQKECIFDGQAGGEPRGVFSRAREARPGGSGALVYDKHMDNTMKLVQGVSLSPRMRMRMFDKHGLVARSSTPSSLPLVQAMLQARQVWCTTIVSDRFEKTTEAKECLLHIHLSMGI